MNLFVDEIPQGRAFRLKCKENQKQRPTEHYHLFAHTRTCVLALLCHCKINVQSENTFPMH